MMGMMDIKGRLHRRNGQFDFQKLPRGDKIKFDNIVEHENSQISIQVKDNEYGPHTSEVVDLIQLAELVTEAEGRAMRAAWDAEATTQGRNKAGLGLLTDYEDVWNTAWKALQAAGREEALRKAWDAGLGVTKDTAQWPVKGAIIALSARDLIREDQFDMLIGPWASVMGVPPKPSISHQHIDMSSNEYTERFAKAKAYVKSAVVQATRARGGERIVTVLADGTSETVNTCNPGDYVVTNPGGEQYVLAPDKFAKRYESQEDGSYRAKGMCRAFPNPTGGDVSVTAPWGEEQRGGTNAMFAVAVDSAEAGISKDRYIIGGEEFANTYIEA